MSAEYVPVVDRDGEELWITPLGDLRFRRPDGQPGGFDGDPVEGGWRRLYVREEPAPFEHSDMCEDGLTPHATGEGVCRCLCSRCWNGSRCICPDCRQHPWPAAVNQ